jgi:hypothetical protein
MLGREGIGERSGAPPHDIRTGEEHAHERRQVELQRGRGVARGHGGHVYRHRAEQRLARQQLRAVRPRGAKGWGFV